MTTIKT